MRYYTKADPVEDEVPFCLYVYFYFKWSTEAFTDRAVL